MAKLHNSPLPLPIAEEQFQTSPSCTAVQTSSLPGFKDQSKFKFHPKSISMSTTHLFNMLLSVLLLLAQNPTVVRSRSIANISPYGSIEQELSLDTMMDDISLGDIRRAKRAALSNSDPTLWPNYTIPFVFEEPFPRRYKKQVMNAMGVWNKRTCIRFVDRTDEEYYAKFIKNDYSCSSRVGLWAIDAFQRMGQPVRLTVPCLQDRGSIMHELGHLIGFYHEQQRPDRDRYIRVFTNNILPLFVAQFEKYSFTTYGEYDFNSIMHYPLNFYVNNGSAMEVLPNVTVPDGVEIGHMHTLSVGDYTKARLMYKCPTKHKVTEAPVTEAATETPPPPIDGNNIYTGEQVALRLNRDTFGVNSWLKCTGYQCAVDKCVGKSFRQGDLNKCQDNIFYLHKIHPGTLRRGSGVVKVGDSIVLERKTVAEGARRGYSKFVFCNAKTQVCLLSQVCVTGVQGYNTSASFCREHVLIVRAEGKEVGDPILHTDIVGFEFVSIHSSTQQCAFGCDHVTRVCSKKLCIFPTSNTLPGDSPTDTDSPTISAQVCGKDMFFIQKL